MLRRFLLVLLLFLAACAADLRETQEGGTSSDDGVETPSGDGVTEPAIVRVDASDDDLWVYYDLETQSYVTPEDPRESLEWDLGFRRFNIKLNGGVSGSGGMELAVVEGAFFENVDEVPDGEWATDRADGPDRGEEPDYAFTNVADGWYFYDLRFHTLTPRDYVYVVRTVEGNFYKVALLDYYDAVGTSGFPTIQYLRLED